MAKQKTHKHISDAAIIEAARSSRNVAEAVLKTGLTFNAYKYRALKLGVYDPTNKNAGRLISLEEILNGHHPHYQTFKLRNRLLKEGVMQNVCSECGVGPTWNSKPISCQLDHIDGDRFNHRRQNLRMICPNCHSQTETFSGKNK
jgi:hypothetical protein